MKLCTSRAVSLAMPSAGLSAPSRSTLTKNARMTQDHSTNPESRMNQTNDNDERERDPEMRFPKIGGVSGVASRLEDCEPI